MSIFQRDCQLHLKYLSFCRGKNETRERQHKFWSNPWTAWSSLPTLSPIKFWSLQSSLQQTRPRSGERRDCTAKEMHYGTVFCCILPPKVLYSTMQMLNCTPTLLCYEITMCYLGKEKSKTLLDDFEGLFQPKWVYDLMKVALWHHSLMLSCFKGEKKKRLAVMGRVHACWP